MTLFFTLARSELAARIEELGRAVFPDRALWIAWPKRASGVATDMTEDVVREVALPLGLVDNKVCAIDATWSGLRLVWRRERRNEPRSSRSYEPMMLIARAPTTSTVANESTDSVAISAFAGLVNGSTSVGLNATEFVSET